MIATRWATALLAVTAAGSALWPGGTPIVAGPSPNGRVALRSATEDWSAARARVAADARLRDWVQGRIRRLTGWMARYGDRPEWIAGWSHELVDPKTKLPVAWTWELSEPAPGTAAHGAWVHYRRTANIQNVQEAARLYRLTGEQRFAGWAADQLDLYADAYRGWPIQTRNGRSQMMGQSLDEAVAAVALADAVRLLGDEVPAGRRRHWDRELFDPMLANLQASNRARDNISLWQACAAAILAIELDRPSAFDRAINGPGGVRDMLAKGITADQLWFEPSAGYAAYAQQALGHLLVAADLAERGATLADVKQRLHNWLVGQAKMRFADGTMPATGDSAPGRLALRPAVLELTQRVVPIPAPPLPIGWTLILDPPPEAAASPSPAPEGTDHWPTMQTAMLRKDGWELFFRYGQTNRSHAQYDALSYDLRYRGTILTEPPGVTAYGSPLFLDYVRRSIAHVMPMIDGKGQQRLKPGELVQLDNHRVAARHGAFAGGGAAQRGLELSANGVLDTLRAFAPPGQRARLGSVFNTPCRLAGSIAATAAEAPLGEGFSFWRNIRATAPLRQWQAVLQCDGQSFALSLSVDRPARVYLAAAPDRTGKPSRTAIYAETAGPQSDLTLRLAIRPR